MATRSSGSAPSTDPVRESRAVAHPRDPLHPTITREGTMADRLEQARTAALAIRERTHADQVWWISVKPLVAEAEEVGFEPTTPGIWARPLPAGVIAESGP
jgi:hypothetical protein